MTHAFEIPIDIVSELNWRGFWAERHSRIKKQKGLTYAYCLKYLGYPGKGGSPEGKYLITLTRIMGYRQRKYDDDNLRGAFKAVRDGIAKYMQIDDGSDRLTWHYRQEKRDWAGVGVEIRKVEA